MPPPIRQIKQGFTLVELLVSMAITLLIMIIVFSASDMTLKMSRRVSGDVSAFQDAAIAFASLTQNLSAATLDTHYDFYPPQQGTNPQAPGGYIRQSGLHFVISRVGAFNGAPLEASSSWNTNEEENPTFGVFFQAPLGYTSSTGAGYTGLGHILNACGYYIQFGSDKTYLAQPLVNALPAGSPVLNRYRFRLMQFIQPSENLGVYATSGANNSYGWYTSPIAFDSAEAQPSVVKPLASNIIALILTPKATSLDAAAGTSGGVAISTDYTYDSRDVAGLSSGSAVQIAAGRVKQSVRHNQLPPVVRVTMVAIDEASAILLQSKFGSNPPTPALVDPSLFTRYDATDENGTYFKDLATLVSNLSNYTPKINFHVFTAEVAIPGAKWNTTGTN